MHYRLKQAYDPIVYTERSILDIALDCGFADARGLINAFKRVYGDTPYQYRKMHMQKKEHETKIIETLPGNCIFRLVFYVNKRGAVQFFVILKLIIVKKTFAKRGKIIPSTRCMHFEMKK